MKSLTEMLRERCEIGEHKRDGNIISLLSDEAMFGAQFENTRLRPILKALEGVVEAAAWVNEAQVHEGAYEALDARLEALRLVLEGK